MMSASAQGSTWHCEGHRLDLSRRPVIMGILNVTPDSFSDGGRDSTPADAVARARQMLADGADIIDVGGESTRPGAAAVSVEAECDRVIPVIKGIMAEEPDALVSIDTMKAAVARAAVEAGAVIINDVSAATHDPAMAAVIRDTRAGLVLMHMRGVPRTMQEDPRYRDVVAEVRDYLETRAAAVCNIGCAPQRIAIDPGIGFGKTLSHNIELLRGIELFIALGYPVCIGLSRKRMVGAITGEPVDERLAGSLAGAVWSALHGARILRVHDVRETRDALAVAGMVSGNWEVETATC